MNTCLDSLITTLLTQFVSVGNIIYIPLTRHIKECFALTFDDGEEEDDRHDFMEMFELRF